MREGGSLIAHGEPADPKEYAEAMLIDVMTLGRCYERHGVDGVRELIDPRIFLHTCSKCGRGFFEDASTLALEGLARGRCAPCRRR